MKLIKAFVLEENEDSLQQLKKFAEDNAIIITLCGFSDSIKNGISQIKEQKPELLFMNPTASNLADFGFLKELNFNLPKIIFISDEKALAYDAYRFNAIDFLLKPLEFNDLIVSVYKAIKTIEMEVSFQNQKLFQINAINMASHSSEFLAISFVDKIELIKIDEIVFCKAEGSYTEFYMKNGARFLSSKNLGEYKDILPIAYFFRIHHSYVINIKHIVKINKKDGLYCEFTNGISLPIAKRRQEEFVRFIKL